MSGARMFAVVLALWGATLPPLPVARRQAEAFQYLERAWMLQSPGIGFGLRWSHGLVAMRIIDEREDADALYKHLLKSRNKVAQIYGLIGLGRTDPAFFRAALPAYECDTSEIGHFHGCILGASKVSHLARELASGRMTRAYLGPVTEPSARMQLEDALRTYTFADEK